LNSAPDRAAPAPPIAAADSGSLDLIFGALSDPIRRGIVARLTHGPCSVTEVGAPFAVSAPAISRHLGVLERCGLIARWQVGRVHYCRLTAQPLIEAAAWIEHHQAFWERQLDALAEYLDREDENAVHPLAGTGTNRD
jgi:DNA-binding transcriptional ArsR family regulator